MSSSSSNTCQSREYEQKWWLLESEQYFIRLLRHALIDNLVATFPNRQVAKYSSFKPVTYVSTFKMHISAFVPLSYTAPQIEWKD